jgi:RNA polymerase sigma-70 factor (ECF subfamily)
VILSPSPSPSADETAAGESNDGRAVRSPGLADNGRGVRPDQAEFEDWFRTCHAAVYRFAYRRVGADVVEDVVAEAFLTAWRRRAEITGDPLPWLLGVTRRACANHLRGRGRRAALLNRLTREPGGLHLDASSSDGRLGGALMSLSDADREVLLLVAWDGLSHAEAAAVMGCSAATFGVRLHRARARLARALPADGHSISHIESTEVARDVI